MEYNIRIIVLCAALTCRTAVFSAELTFYLAPNGNDQWSGTKPSPSKAKTDGPFATLPVALKAVRDAHLAGRGGEGTRVLLRGGAYTLTEPIVFGAQDSGVAGKPLVIAAYRDEKPLLSGGQRLTGWHPVVGKPDLWEVQIPEVRAGQWYFRELFVNERRAKRARTPNEGFFRIQGASPQEKPVQLHFKPGEIQREWADAGDVEVIALLAWADFRLLIRAVDEVSSIATLSGNARTSNKENNARYYIENAPDGLDSPGEWYLNRKTGLLRYWARTGENPNEMEVVAPRLHQLVKFQGTTDPQEFVQHIELRGLTFAYSDWTMATNGYADTQAAVSVRGDIFGENAAHISIQDCTLKHLGGYAIELGKGCQNNRIVGNTLFDLGAGGVRLGEPAKRAAQFDQTFGNIVTDNEIHHLGEVYPPAVGVFIQQSGNNRIAHNHIHHLYYTAVSIGWNWGYQETPCHDNVVEFNHLHDIGQAMLSDMGAIYTLGIQQGTIIRNNLIHDVNSFTYGGWGLYPDEGSTGIVWENNVVYRTKSAGFHQHYGHENIVRNNIFAFGKEYQMMRTREEEHTSFVFTNNIVMFDSGNLLGSNWKNDHFVADYNLYFDRRIGTNTATMKFSSATLEQWRARGHDQHSIIADPLFLAADKYDFRLKPQSPALKLGFRPIDLRSVGVRPKSKRD